MNLLLRHNTMATAKPQIKAALSVVMMISLNKKNDEKTHNFPACIAISK